MDMCKFTLADDIGYKRVKHQLLSFIKEAQLDMSQG
jgi:hypothetical protein